MNRFEFEAALAEVSELYNLPQNRNRLLLQVGIL